MQANPTRYRILKWALLGICIAVSFAALTVKWQNDTITARPCTYARMWHEAHQRTGVFTGSFEDYLKLVFRHLGKTGVGPRYGIIIRYPEEYSFYDARRPAKYIEFQTSRKGHFTSIKRMSVGMDEWLRGSRLGCL